MKTNLLKLLRDKAQTGKFLAFTYRKNDGEVSKRVLRIGIDIKARMEKEGRPVNGKGNWTTHRTSGLRGFLIKKDGELYIRGVDCSPGKKPQQKVFKISGMSELK